MTVIKTTKDIDALLEKHTEYRNSALNLIASENMVSDTVRAYHSNELIDRYGLLYNR